MKEIIGIIFEKVDLMNLNLVQAIDHSKLAIKKNLDTTFAVEQSLEDR